MFYGDSPRSLISHAIRRPLLAVLAGAAIVGVGMPGTALAQAGEPPAPIRNEPARWNDARVLELMQRARERRSRPDHAPDLQDYQAEANGYVYFYLDQGDAEDRTLVKVDQIALEVFWAAPDLTRQRIIGMRDATKLPSRIHYHLDHLTVVQNEFDDRIRLGDGDEVRDVLHPAAPGADSVYDFRLADSMSIHLAGVSDPIRVYEIEVRPRRMEFPAYIGSVFLDRSSAAIVRMTFTFTPASYVDPRIDYIQVSLDNGLWDGRHWLPNEQRLEIRRELPVLDFPAGTVIQGRFRVGGYRFNQGTPRWFFRGPPVVALPREQRERHEFPTGIFDDLNDKGLATHAELIELRRRAVRLAGRRELSGLPRLRLFIPDASSVLRYNRAEGAFLGAGARYALFQGTVFELSGGHALGAARTELSGALRHDFTGDARLRLAADHDSPRDLGVRPGAPGVLNTLHAALAAKDYSDLYFVSGLRASLERPLASRWRAWLDLAYEEHESAKLAAANAPFQPDASFRPVLPIDEGRMASIVLGLARGTVPEAAATWGGSLEVEAGSLDGESFAQPTIGLTTSARTDGHRLALQARGAAGIGFGTLPAQRLFLLGGRSTLPGYAFRSFAGDRFVLADFEASAELLGPWARLRGLGAIGWTGFANNTPPAAWEVAETGGIRASLGLGLGLVYDVLRVDLVRGLRDGRWETIISTNPRFWGIL